MTKKTHLAIGTLVSLPIMASITGVIGIIGILGSIAPDIDIKLGLTERTKSKVVLVRKNSF